MWSGPIKHQDVEYPCIALFMSLLVYIGFETLKLRLLENFNILSVLEATAKSFVTSMTANFGEFLEISNILSEISVFSKLTWPVDYKTSDFDQHRTKIRMFQNIKFEFFKNIDLKLSHHGHWSSSEITEKKLAFFHKKRIITTSPKVSILFTRPSMKSMLLTSEFNSYNTHKPSLHQRTNILIKNAHCIWCC